MLFWQLCATCSGMTQDVTLKFIFSRKAPKIDKIFTIDLTICSKCRIYGKDFASLCDLLIENMKFKKFWNDARRFKKLNVILGELFLDYSEYIS